MSEGPPGPTSSVAEPDGAGAAGAATGAADGVSTVAGESAQALKRLETLAAQNNQPSHPKLRSFAVVGAKADLAFVLYAAELGAVAQMHRDLENCFPAGVAGTTIPVAMGLFFGATPAEAIKGRFVVHGVAPRS